MDYLLEPKFVTVPGLGTMRLCGFESCPDAVYSRGVCKGHYHQHRHYGVIKELWHPWEVEYPPCSFEGCRNTSSTKTGRIYCQGHINMIYAGKELVPLSRYKNDGYTPDGRVCKNCGEEKPLDEFYSRNKHKDPASTAKSTQCKACYKHDIRYYQGRVDKKSDGSDPMDYANDPDEQNRRLEKWSRAGRKN